MDIYDDYLLKFHENDIGSILTSDWDAEPMSVYVDMCHLQREVPELFQRLQEDAWEERRKWNASLVRAQQKILSNDVFLAGSTDLRDNCYVTLHNLPPSAGTHFSTEYPTLSHVGKLVQIKGSVVRMSKSVIVEYRRQYTCSRCKKTVMCHAQYFRNFAFDPPTKCPDADGPNKCRGRMQDLSSTKDPMKYMQYQEFTMQELLSVSVFPTVMIVTLEEDLVEICDAGDRVIACGVLQYQFQWTKEYQKPTIKFVLRAISVWSEQRKLGTKSADEVLYAQLAWQELVEVEGEAKARERIVASFAPKTLGMQCIKLALCIVLCSGGLPRKTDTSRQNSHMLLVGDPSLGKSSLISFAAEITPRSIYTTGVGSTKAGLTAAVVRESGKWHLEAGALVLADGGICCIDEFHLLSNSDKGSIHECLEQQTLSIAKAGLVCTRRTRCSVIAAMNPKTDPKGQTPEERELAAIGLGSPLLSRFDLIFELKDDHDADWDEVVATYVLGKIVGLQIDHQREGNDDKLLLDKAKLQAHFEMIRDIQPQLLGSTKKILEVYYRLCRQTYHNYLRGRTTVRLHNSLERLTKAHAKLMARTQATVVDATAIVFLMESSWGYGGILPPVNTISGELSYPTEEMIEQVLFALSLTREDIREDEQQPPTQPIVIEGTPNSSKIEKSRREGNQNSQSVPNRAENSERTERSHKRKHSDDSVSSQQSCPAFPTNFALLNNSQGHSKGTEFGNEYSKVYEAIDTINWNLDDVDSEIKENHENTRENSPSNDSFQHCFRNFDCSDFELD
ncbi:DNA helicase MCM9-like [Lutzomyia longipalpis]|uniref:DNA helicase MCM9-like n=1 Tax=Lutzomyia longipalpis TaxID=7200 RepID=UPI0024842749|nr:DNA helicase MCM9-like [Lutzomyia longipalpis]XP_055693740.1 DNA helicase MCM9-like [Lutzomyia longipalpis]XP_055693742.1 DNA helicase MCM9-like [Lutzomyia longipalpis]